MSVQHETDEAAIRQQVDAIAEGLRARDLEALRALYAPDVVSFDIEPPLQHVGIDAKLRNWERVFDAYATVDYELRDLAVTVDGRVAFGHAFGRLSGTLADGTAAPGMWVRGTFGLRRDGDRWVIAHDQVSVPFDVRS
ncbi:MAG: YybH family protein, partial [Pseudonocardia sp.]